MPDFAAPRESLGLPPLGVKLDREQSLSLSSLGDGEVDAPAGWLLDMAEAPGRRVIA
jgi:hypothetical protein